MQSEVFEGPWWQPPSCLDREQHATLIANLDAICARSGFGHDMRRTIWEPLPKEIGDKEREWVKSRIGRAPEPAHLRLSGPPWALRERCYQLAGALLRNFTDARVMSADAIIEDVLSGNGEISGRVLFVPDFCVLAETESKPTAAKRTLISVVRQRLVTGQTTVIGVPKINVAEHLSKCFGAEFAEELQIIFKPWSVAG